MTLPTTSKSSSHEQRKAEAVMVAALADEFGALTARRIPTERGYVKVDGANEDQSVLVESFARIGRLKPGQTKKIARDILKFALLKRQPGREHATTVIALASDEALASVTGWLLEAAEEFKVEFRVVQLPTDVHEAVLAAQELQRMVNTE